MEIMIQRFCKRYKLPEAQLHILLSHMEEVRFDKEEPVVQIGERNSRFYILKKGIWRAYSLMEGIEKSLWFVSTGDAAFSSWGYVNHEASEVCIESVHESVAYSISKPELDKLFYSSIEMANFGRRLFEQEIVSVDCATLSFNTPNAKERYLMLLKSHPELLQYVPLKHLASYLYITPQSLSRIRAGFKQKRHIQ